MSAINNQKVDLQVRQYYVVISKYYYHVMILAFFATIVLAMLGFLPNYYSTLFFGVGIVGSIVTMKSDTNILVTNYIQYLSICLVIIVLSKQVPQAMFSLTILGVCITSLYLVSRLLYAYGIIAVMLTSFLQITLNLYSFQDFWVKICSLFFSVVCLSVLVTSVKKLYLMLLKSQENEVALTEKAEKDLMTDAFNKVSTENIINRNLDVKKELTHYFLIIDIDNFKSVNDMHGHYIGDGVICEVAKALKSIVRQSDVVGRIGGDEFVVLLSDIKSLDDVSLKVEELKLRLYEVGKQLRLGIPLTVSIGISCSNSDGLDYQSLYQKADVALYQSKLAGKDVYSFYKKTGIETN